MRVIPTKIHGLLDYVSGLILIASPWLFDFADGGVKMWLPVILGVSALLYSLLTNYELGAVKKIEMPVHLTLDLLSGILLAVSPWLFGFSEDVYLPHLVLGLFEIVASVMTKKTPSGMHVGPRLSA
jgi:hypothetical protein